MLVRAIDEKEIDALIERIKQAKSDRLSLTDEDIDLVLKMLISFASFNEQLSDNDITLNKLRKLAGLVNSSEKLKDIVPSVLKAKSKPENTVIKVEKEVIAHKTCHHKLEGLVKGQLCPECEKGKLYKYEPSITVRISGQSPLECTKHILEKLRCNTCGVYFTAQLPFQVKLDGDSGQTYGYSARAIMAIYKYFGGVPFYRQESLNNLFGMPVSASTVFEQCELVANVVHPVFQELIKLSANAFHYNIDDTTNKILNQSTEMIADRKTGKLKERSGIYTSGVIAKLDDGNKIVLFKTNIGHAGEWIDQILRNRNPNAPPPILMSDALSSNLPTVIKDYHLSLCNAHARREFVNVYQNFPDKVEWVLQKYGKIWENESNCRVLLTSERLAYHQKYSLPVMEDIRQWGNNMFDTNEVEENSGLGKALKYFIKHFNALTTFCSIQEAKLDNNEMEATLKLIIRGRKNSLFFKTQTGADIADVLTSIIATCNKQNINSFHYLTALQQNSQKVTYDPKSWLPWNYIKTLTHLIKDNVA
jgi:hypothetical protein